MKENKNDAIEQPVKVQQAKVLLVKENLAKKETTEQKIKILNVIWFVFLTEPLVFLIILLTMFSPTPQTINIPLEVNLLNIIILTFSALLSIIGHVFYYIANKSQTISFDQFITPFVVSLVLACSPAIIAVISVIALNLSLSNFTYLHMALAFLGVLFKKPNLGRITMVNNNKI